eukprot:scaffold3577_cov114-Skeletonema_dohrnii-CCMP3373.AAC.4
MSNIIRPSFRSSEKRKAKALRQTLGEVLSGTHSPFTFSPGVYTSSLSTSVVKRYLENDERNSEEPSQANKADGTPLFASQHNTQLRRSHDSNINVGLFGYSCNDDSSVASPLRRINGGGHTLNAFNQALTLPSSATCHDGTAKEKLHNVKKRLKYTPDVLQSMCDSDVDVSTLLGTQPETGSPKILSSSSYDGHCGSSVHSETGTVHEDWIIEEEKVNVKGSSSSFVKEGSSGIDAFEASFTLASPESSDPTNLEQSK